MYLWSQGQVSQYSVNMYITITVLLLVDGSQQNDAAANGSDVDDDDIGDDLESHVDLENEKLEENLVLNLLAKKFTLADVCFKWLVIHI